MGHCTVNTTSFPLASLHVAQFGDTYQSCSFGTDVKCSSDHVEAGTVTCSSRDSIQLEESADLS